MSFSHLRRVSTAAAFVLTLLLVGVSVSASDGGTLAERVQRICSETPARVTAAFCSMQPGSIRLLGPDGASVDVDVLIADNAVRRAAGYQFIAGDVVQETAIFFLFEAATAGSFHMCNVEVPLDIIWFRANGSILDALLMRPGGVGNPSLCAQTYQPRRFGAYQFALELPEGGIERLGISNLAEWSLDVGSWN